jgi:co-chaperonin GroES (HSP10)
MEDLNPSKEVVVLEDAGAQKTKSGLDLPTQEGKSKPEIGRVVAFGLGTQPVPFKIGDKIVYRKYMDNKIQVGVKSYNFIDFKDILAVIKD